MKKSFIVLITFFFTTLIQGQKTFISPDSVGGFKNGTLLSANVLFDSRIIHAVPSVGANSGSNTSTPETTNYRNLNSTIGSFTTLIAPVNDLPSGAIALTVNGGCTGDIYDNSTATQSVNEPTASCAVNPTGFKSVWFKFVAPAESVKISCDGAGTLTNSKMALFSVTDVNNFATFDIISCDDDNGTNYRSLFYSSGLTAGVTYYVVVDIYSPSFSGAGGTFCLTVDLLRSTMLANTAADCLSGKEVKISTTYTGWVSLVDANGKLNVNVRQNAGTATSFTSSRTIKTGASRVDGLGQPYLNRNFLINAPGATNADVQLFFLSTEVATLGGTITGYNVTRSSGTVCTTNCGTGTNTLLSQTANDIIGGVSYIQVTTPGFSNFFIHNSATVLPLFISFFRGSKLASANYLDWKVTCTSQTSVQLSLERSADGRSFTAIDNQAATATRCLQGFNYTDTKPLAGSNYYRLKTTSPDGKIGYSTIVVLINKEKGFELISLAPNPVQNNAVLSLTTVKGGNMAISVSDVAGKVITKKSTIVIAGNNSINMNFATLGAGTYIISATNDLGELKTTRFVKL